MNKNQNQILKVTTIFGSIVALSLAITGCSRENSQESLKGEEKAELTFAPNVPPPIKRTSPTKVVVDLEVVEVKKQLSAGVEYMVWTFGGQVPGKFIRVREGDLVEFHLHNHPENKMPHNIDLHAVTGPGGGAASSLTAPGHSSVFSFKVINPGLYVYHCATAPVGMHIANGMYGLILVEPKAGLPKVDREYYVMQSEFYTKGRHGQAGFQPFSMEKALLEHPDYVVFNGAEGSLTGDNALKTKVGETVRIFVGNGGPSLISSFHVIGEIFDKVYPEGGLRTNEQVQTTLVPAGGSAIVEFKMEVPGTYILVDHSIFRTFNKGALGMLKAEGPEDKEIYSGKLGDQVYLPEGGAIQSVSEKIQPAIAKNLDERIAFGKTKYQNVCAACHQLNGEGIPSAFPPLAKSDYLNADKKRSIQVVMHGLQGKVTVNGEEFNGVMPKLDLTDEDIANVLTYVYKNWDNKGYVITADEVKAVRAEGPKDSSVNGGH